MTVLISGGRILTATDDYVADVLIEGEGIVAIGHNLDAAATRTIDASGKYVLPGGVDPHAHLAMPEGAVATCDDFTSGTVAAAFGGTTTQIDFCMQRRGESFQDTVQAWHAELQRAPPVTDVGFHLVITDLEAGGLEGGLEPIIDDGISSLKLFMAYKGTLMVDDSTVFRVMRLAAAAGALVMVHAEHGEAIEILINEALAKGRTEPKYHALTRPPETEGEAVNRAIQLARIAGCRLYLVHVSCEESLGPVARARASGWNVCGETCPHYLLIDDSVLDQPGFDAAKYVYTPPPRAKSNQEHLWRALASDVLSVVATDHTAFRFVDQKTLGRNDFTKIPNGGPGIEHRLELLHHFGVRTGRLSLNRMVELTSTGPARIFGLYPRKGTLAPGSDADVVVFDPEKPLRISADTHHSKADYSLYEGIEVLGAPDVVLVRGGVVIEDDKLVARPGHGAFVARARAGELLHGSGGPWRPESGRVSASESISNVS
jgi:dihydropyrimidinase